MTAWRTLIHARRELAMLLVALVLFAKVFVPTGYMFTPGAAGFTVQLCSGQGTTPVLLDIGSTAPTEDHSGSGKMDAPCAFSGIGMASIAAVDVALLIVAIAFIVAIATLPKRAPSKAVPVRLRPPLRAPPVNS